MLLQRRFSWCSSREVAFVLMLFWMMVIFFLSALSGKLTVEEPPLWFFIERKGAHVVEYALLTILSYHYFRLSFLRETTKRVLLLAAGFSIMYATTDELHQFFVLNRGAKMTDVLIDSGGIGVAVFILLFWMSWQQRKNRS